MSDAKLDTGYRISGCAIVVVDAADVFVIAVRVGYDSVKLCPSGKIIGIAERILVDIAVMCGLVDGCPVIGGMVPAPRLYWKPASHSS